MFQVESTKADALRHATDLDAPSYGAMPQDRTSMPGIGQYIRIELLHPWVIRSIVGSDPLREFQAAYVFLSKCRKRKTMFPWRTTHQLKHDAQAASGECIGEGSYIRAALLAGFVLTKVRGLDTYRMNIVNDLDYWDMVSALEQSRREEHAATPDWRGHRGAYA